MIEDLGDEAYEYFAVLEADKIKMKDMKDKVSTDYYRRVRKIFESSLKEGNTVKEMNTWAVAAVRHAAGNS